MGTGEFRVEFDGRAILGDGLVQLPLVVQGDAEVVVGRRISGRVRWPVRNSAMASSSFPWSFRAMPRLLWATAYFGSSSMAWRIAGDGLVQLPLVLQGDAEVVVGVGEFRVEFDGLCGSRRWPRPASPGPSGRCRGCCGPQASFGSSSMARAVAGDGLVQLPLVSQGVAEVVVGDGEFRVEFDGLCGSRRWPRPASPDPSGRCRGCCGPWRISGRVRWPGGSRRWPRPASPGSSGRCRGCCGPGVFRVEFDGLAVAAMASSSFPWSFRASPRLLWAMANFGSSSMAWR